MLASGGPAKSWTSTTSPACRSPRPAASWWASSPAATCGFSKILELRVSDVMTRENLVTATGTVTLEEAEKILMAKKVEKLLLVDEDYTLTGLITIKDIDMMKRFPNACKDAQGRLARRCRRRRARLRAGRKPASKGRRRARGRQCARPFGQRHRDRQETQRTLGHRRGRRKHCHRRRLQGSDRRRRRRRQSGHRPGVDLHHAGHFRRGRAADHGHLRSRAGGRRSTTCRSSPTAAFATRAT